VDIHIIEALLDEFGITEDKTRSAVRKHLSTMPNAVGAELRKRRGSFASLFAGSDGQKAGALKSLATHISQSDEMGATIPSRSHFLSSWFRIFPCETSANISVPLAAKADKIEFSSLKASITCIPVSELVAMVGEIVACQADQDLGFIHYCQTVQNAAARISRMRERMIGNGMTTVHVYRVIHLFHQNHLAYDRLSHASVVALHQLLRVCPPNNPFPGIASWGPGDQGNVQDNITHHFCKHALNATKEAVALTECRVWWRVLGISFTRSAARGLCSVPMFNGIANLFPANDDDEIVNDKVPLLLTEFRSKGWPDKVVSHFINDVPQGRQATNRDAYKNIALAMAGTLTAVAVYPSGATCFVSGRFDGHGETFYLIGRLGAGGVLGLSSCYVAHDIAAKLRAREIAWSW